MEENAGQGNTLCYGPGSIAGAVIGTFLTTILLLAVAVVFYRQWRKNKGKHLVLVTDPEIVEDAYAFDNPCFKDATPASGGRNNMDRPLSIVSIGDRAKDFAKWSSPWSSLGLGSGNKFDKRRTLDDSCLGPNATRVSVISLRSRDFTGLGFNVCGNMREGIFVKDLLHRGPASESGRIHPGDRITSVKISFRSMVYEDALTILSYASPYDVELEVESGGSSSRPTTLLKKTVGPSPSRICHPLYRSQSIPELSRVDKSLAKRLFIADPNDSFGSNYSTMNSTLKSSKSTPGSHTLERRHEESKANNHHYKFGIKVLPALDGTVYRIENQNEHNTNLERHNSRKMDVEKNFINAKNVGVIQPTTANEATKLNTDNLQQRDNPKSDVPTTIDATDNKSPLDKKKKVEEVVIPSEVPAEVHNAAMAARKNRKNSAELLKSPKLPEVIADEEKKSPQKSKRKAPAPPDSPMKDNSNNESVVKKEMALSSKPERENTGDDKIESIADYTESLNDYVGKVREITNETQVRRSRLNERSTERGNSESDTDSEMQNSFTTIELNPADITIHHTPIPHVGDRVDDDDDGYRKAASLGDLSKYEAKTPTTLERAQSLDMTDTGSRKRKTPLPEDIAESTEDLTKLDDIDTFDRRKLKKSSEWGTLEDAIWNKIEADDVDKKPKTRKKSSGTLERSKSSVEIKLKEDTTSNATPNEDKNGDCSIELYNLPLSKRLTSDFIEAERSFNPDEDNSLARIVNNGEVVKSPTIDEIELDFRQAKPLKDDIDQIVNEAKDSSPVINETFGKAFRFFDLHANKTSLEDVKMDIDETMNGDDIKSSSLYTGMKEVDEQPMKKVTVIRKCPGCEQGGHHHKNCTRHTRSASIDSDYSEEKSFKNIENQIEKVSSPRTNFNVNENEEDEDVDDGCDLGSSVTVNSKSKFSPNGDRHNVSNVSVSSGENSEDSGLVGESGEFSQREIMDVKPMLSNSSSPLIQDTSSPRKMTYITEIKVSPSREIIREPSENEVTREQEQQQQQQHNKPSVNKSEVTVTPNGKSVPGKKPPVPPRRSDASKAHKEHFNDKQAVYVSEYKTIDKTKGDTPDSSTTANKKIDHWIYLSDNNKEQNPWGNGSSQSQSVTNIVVASNPDKITHHK